MRIALLFAVLILPLSAGDVSIRYEGGSFRVVGWTPPATEPEPGWASIFAVYAGQEGVPPMLGAYSVENGTLVFRPRFAPGPGVRARAVLKTSTGAPLETAFDTPKADLTPRTRVVQVYPTAKVLPENQLKFYIDFSEPMARGEAWRHLRLLKKDGTAVDLPFLEIDQELWDRDNRRLTVLFDPGRIKRGVLPLEETGPAIEEGRSYSLVIGRGFLDARGAPLTAEFRKEFHVGPGDRDPIDPAKWRVTTPRSDTSDPLVVDLGEPVDHALALRMIRVEGVDGSAVMDRNEMVWRFTPAVPWKAGEYRLDIDTALEDLAGNRVGRAFDVDVFERVSKTISRETVKLPFRIGR